MANDSSIDAIKVSLGVDARGIRPGVEAANKEIAKLGTGKSPVIHVQVTPAFSQGSTAFMRRIDELKKGITVPVDFKLGAEGKTSLSALRGQVTKAIKEAGGIQVPIDLQFAESKAAAIHADIQKKMNSTGPIKIYFDWVARGGPPPAPGQRGGGPPGGGGGGDTTADHERRTAAQAETEHARQRTRTARAGRSQSARQHTQQQQSSTPAGSAGSSPDTQRAERAADTARREAARAQERAARQTISGSGTAPTTPRRATGAPRTGSATGGIATAPTAGNVNKRGEGVGVRRTSVAQQEADRLSIDQLRPYRAEVYDEADARRMQVSREDIRDERATGRHDSEWIYNPKTKTWVPQERAGRGVRGASRAGSVPRTVNPAMGTRMEARLQKERAAQQTSAITSLRNAGVLENFPDVGEALDITDPAERNRVLKAIGREYTQGMDSKTKRKVRKARESLPLSIDPQVFGFALGDAAIAAQIFGTSAEETGGANVNLRGDPLKRGASRRSLPSYMGETDPFKNSKNVPNERPVTAVAENVLPAAEVAKLIKGMDLKSEAVSKAMVETNRVINKNAGPRYARGIVKGSSPTLGELAAQQASPIENPELERQRAAAAEAARYRRIPGMAEGGNIYSREFGQSFNAEGRVTPGKANSYEWKKARNAQIRKQPWCSHCGIGRAEERSLNNRTLEGEHTQSAAHGGDFAPDNTLCKSCNSSKSGFSHDFGEKWTHARPAGIVSHPKMGSPSRKDFLPGGRFFMVSGIADALRKRAEGGSLRHTGAAERGAQPGHDPDVTMVGERGSELIVDGEVIPHHRVQTWLGRAREGHGIASRAGGGPVSFRGRTGFVSGSGPQVVNAAGMVQRVWVTNWPVGGMGGVAIGAPVGAASAVNQNQPGPQVAPNVAQILQQAVAGPGGALAQPGAAAVNPKYKRGAGAKFSSAAMARSAGATGAEAMRMQLADISSQINEAQAMTPARAVTTLMAQLTTQLTGRAQVQRRAREASTMAGFAGTSISEYRSAQVAMRQTRDERRELYQLSKQAGGLDQAQLARMKELNGLYSAQLKTVRELRSHADRLIARAGKSAQGIAGPSDVLKNVASAMAGITVGTIAFSAVFTAANTALAAGTEIAGKWLERATGFQNIAAGVTNALSDQTKAAAGASHAVTSLAMAQTGLSKSESDAIQPTIERRVQVEAGNKSMSEAIGFLHTFEAVQAQNAGKPGGERGLSQTTGGLFGSIINGIPSTAELIGNELAGVPAGGTPGSGPFGLLPNDAMRLKTAQDYLKQNPQPGGGTQVGPFQFGGVKASDWQVQKDIVAQTEIGQGRIDFFNKALEKGGESVLRFKAQTDDTVKNLNQWTREAAANAAEAGGAFGIASDIRAQKVVITDAQGNIALKPEQYTQALGAANTGFQFQDPAELMKKLTGQNGFMGALEVAARSIRRQGMFERQYVNPAETALQYAAHPLTPYGKAGTGQIPDKNVLGGGAAPGFDKTVDQYSKAFQKYASLALPAQKTITDEIKKGDQAMRDLVPQDLLPEFDQTLGMVKEIGLNIQKIQWGIDQKQLNLQVAQYNNELRIARRSLADAKDMQAGIAGATKDTLGGLEGQNIALSRQLQLLGFELQQRQINYKLALAGFVAPGSTPEERQARIDEAKIEAAYAQKQLDLQKQIASNQFKGTKIEVGRSVQDLTAQIALLTQGKALAIDTSAAQKAIEQLQGAQDILMKKARSMMKEGMANADLMMKAITDLEAESGKALAGFEGDLVAAFQKAGKGFATSIIDVFNMMNTAFGNNPRPSVNDRGKNAPGALFSTSGATRLTVGEAGTETVAILRNPRSLTMGGGFGGSGGVNVGGITINISGGASSGSMADNERLANLLARKVEERLSRKLSLIGARTTFGTL